MTSATQVEEDNKTTDQNKDITEEKDDKDFITDNFDQGVKNMKDERDHEVACMKPNKETKKRRQRLKKSTVTVDSSFDEPSVTVHSNQMQSTFASTFDEENDMKRITETNTSLDVINSETSVAVFLLTYLLTFHITPISPHLLKPWRIVTIFLSTFSGSG